MCSRLLRNRTMIMIMMTVYVNVILKQTFMCTVSFSQADIKTRLGLKVAERKQKLHQALERKSNNYFQIAISCLNKLWPYDRQYAITEFIAYFILGELEIHPLHPPQD